MEINKLNFHAMRFDFRMRERKEGFHVEGGICDEAILKKRLSVHGTADGIKYDVSCSCQRKQPNFFCELVAYMCTLSERRELYHE